MSRTRATEIYLVNALGQVTRTYQWTNANVKVIQRQDTGRVELVSETKSLEQHAIPFTLLAESTLTKIKKSGLFIGNFGQVRVDVTDEPLSPSFYGQEEDPSQFQQILKKSGLVHVVTLCLILMFSWTYNRFFKPEDRPVTVIPKIIKTVAVKKKKKRVARKVVKASKKKIHKRRIVRKKVAKRSSKKISRRTRITKRPKVKVRNKKVVRRDVRQLGALGALGGISKGSRSGRGLNLNTLHNYSGYGKGAGLKSKGVSTPGLQGRGLIAQSAGGGTKVRNRYGYGTKGRAGGRAGYGKHTISGGSGSYYHPLQEVGQVAGGLERSQIAAVINRNIGQVIYCYEKGLQKQPGLSGRVAVDFVIGGNGRVSKANVARSSLQHRRIESCILRKLRAWRFPKPHGRVDVNVSYPFILRRVSQG